MKVLAFALLSLVACTQVAEVTPAEKVIQLMEDVVSETKSEGEVEAAT